MANVLLINPAIRESAPPNNAPLGHLYIASYLEQGGHTVDVLDLNALRWIDPDRELWLQRQLEPFRCSPTHPRYDIIAIGGLIVTYQEQRAILDYIMEHFDSLGRPMLIGGGGLATSAPEFAFRNMPELDVLVIGEGEMPMLDIANGAKLSLIPGVTTKESSTPSELIGDLTFLPFPAWSKVPIEQVYLHNPIWGKGLQNSSSIEYQMTRSMNMIASRGCPMTCNFCFHEAMGKQYRIRSVSSAILEMWSLRERYHVDFIGILDDNLLARRRWAVDFCERLIGIDWGVHWGCHARVDGIDAELAGLMKSAGCEYVGFGIESADPEMLRHMDKKIDPEQAAEAIRVVKEAGMTANCTYICGYPGETKETIALTAKFMRDNDCVNDMFFATAYPGTTLYEEELERILQKYDSEDDYIKSLGDAKDFLVNYTYTMSDEDLFRYRDAAMKGQVI